MVLVVGLEPTIYQLSTGCFNQLSDTRMMVDTGDSNPVRAFRVYAAVRACPLCLKVEGLVGIEPELLVGQSHS